MAADIDIADETFLVTDRAGLAARLAEPGLWRSWWSELDLSISEDRGEAGMRWEVRGRLSGTAEIWLEPWRDGVIVHWFVRARLARRRAAGVGNEAAGLRNEMVRAHKRRIHRLKDELERTRAPGMPRDPASG